MSCRSDPNNFSSSEKIKAFFGGGEGGGVSLPRNHFCVFSLHWPSADKLAKFLLITLIRMRPSQNKSSVRKKMFVLLNESVKIKKFKKQNCFYSDLLFVH